MPASLRGALGALVKRACGIETIYGHTFVPGLLGSNPLVVDFGCNLGEFAAAFRSRFACQYRAADANPAMAASASERLGLNVEHVAIGGEDGQIDFFLSANPEASSIYPTIALAGPAEAIRVPVLTYGAWARKHGIDSIALLKIDVEGAELDFLKAWDGRVARPGQIAVEFHDFVDPGQRPRVQSCIERLKSQGYWYLNATRPEHTDCLFVDRAKLKGARGLLLRLRWSLLTCFHVLRGRLRGRHSVSRAASTSRPSERESLGVANQEKARDATGREVGGGADHSADQRARG